MSPRPQLKRARVNVPLNTAMALITEPALQCKGKWLHPSEGAPNIMKHYDVPMCWVSVPYLEGTEAAVLATLARIAPEAVPLGLCAPAGHTDGTSGESLTASTLCRHEEGASRAEASRSDSPSAHLSAAGSGESCEEVKFPCADASGSAADDNSQPEGAGCEAALMA